MIDILAFPETTLILVAAIIEPLRAANRIVGQTLYHWRLFSQDGLPIRTTAGIELPVSGRISPASEPAPLFIVSSYSWQNHNTSQTRALLSKAARSRPVVVGIESGIWLMAEAGLLAERRAAIHWEDHENFAGRYNNIDVANDRYVIDGNRITSGGALPTLDLMLEIIRRRQNYAIALEVSRSFLYEKDQNVRDLLPTSTNHFGKLDSRLARALRMMEDSIAQPLSMDELASEVGVSARHLQTLFHQSFGASPHIHYLALRLNTARRMIIESQVEVSSIGDATGFSSPSAFARAYRGQFGESPSETRRRIGGARR